MPKATSGLKAIVNVVKSTLVTRIPQSMAFSRSSEEAFSSCRSREAGSQTLTVSVEVTLAMIVLSSFQVGVPFFLFLRVRRDGNLRLPFGNIGPGVGFEGLRFYRASADTAIASVGPSASGESSAARATPNSSMASPLNGSRCR